MKKLLWILPAVVLLAAACYKQTGAPNQQENTALPTQTQQTTVPQDSANGQSQSGAQSTSTPAVNKYGSTQSDSWKVYTNTKYGFQVSYPFETHEIKIDGSNISIYKKSDLNLPEYFPAVSINIYTNTNNLSAEEYLQAFYTRWLVGPSQKYTDFRINESSTFNGMSAIKFGSERDTYYLIKHGSYMYTINTSDASISSTFKFIK